MHSSSNKEIISNDKKYLVKLRQRDKMIRLGKADRHEQYGAEWMTSLITEMIN